MRNILIAFVVLFFVSTICHATQLKEKVKIEKHTEFEKIPTLSSNVFLILNHSNEILVEKSFKVPLFYETDRKGKVVVLKLIKPNKLETDLPDCKLKEICSNIQRSNYMRIS